MVHFGLWVWAVGGGVPPVLVPAHLVIRALLYMIQCCAQAGVDKSWGHMDIHGKELLRNSLPLCQKSGDYFAIQRTEETA